MILLISLILVALLCFAIYCVYLGILVGKEL